MSIVITAPNGNVGAPLVEALLEAGVQPVLIARNPEKIQRFVDHGATVRRGSHADADFLVEATRGAEALFVLTPNHFQVRDIREHYATFARAAVAAVQANGIQRVVHLSSVGAELEAGNGPVTGLNAAEAVLDAGGTPHLIHLRPAYFMENTMMQIPSILQAGRLFTPFGPGTSFPMIATRDIGRRAAELLLDRSWTGHRIVELLGAGEYSYEEVAATLSTVLERELTHVTVPPAALEQSILAMGGSAVLAAAFVELTEGLAAGLVTNHEPRSEANTTPTTYALFAEQVFKPAIVAAAG